MKDWSINKRILFLTLMPSILMSLVLGIYFISGRSSDLDKLLADRGLSMAKQLAPTCEYGLMTGNIGILQNIANTMLEEQDVRSINIYDADLNLLTRAGPLMLNERRTLSSIHDNQMELRKTEGSLQIKSPVTAQNLSISDVVSEQFFNNTSEPKALLGWVEIELSNTNTRLALYQYFANAIVVISLILLSCTLIALRIGRRITRPINVMMTALEDIREGKLESRVHVAESSELKELASGINSIAASMQHTNMEYQKNIEQVARENQETIDELEIRNHQLTSGKKEAMKANRMKSEFLANVSHEIRTPLNGIIGFSDLLARTQISERQSDYLQNILKSSKDLLSIINDILDLSKIDANKLILENISFNLRDVIEEAQQMVAPDVAAKNISLLQHLDPSLPEMLCGDRLRLKQVLTNLISNAVKFTPQGEVKVAVYPLRQESDRITIQFDITDTGIGLTQEQQKVLFRAFSQADTGISRQYGGTGLGLIISKALVSAMKGDIRIESTPGLGSIFSFTIEADINNESFETPSHLENLKVFVLGEEDIRCSEIMGLLQRWKADVTLFETTAQLSQYHQNWLSSDDSSLCDLIVVSMDRSPALLGALNLLESYAAPFIIIADSEAKDHELSQRFPKSLLVRPYPQQRLLSYIGNAINKKIGHEVSHQRPNFTRAPVIMAVDDHEANLKLLITLLAELGIPVLAARSGYEAVAAVEREHVDLVLMDIQMPGMSGTEATQRIRELPGKSKLPIIAVTAHAMADERRALIDAGMSDYQTKPISIEQLALVIERWTGYRPASLDAEVLTYNQSNPTVSPVFDPNKAMSLTNNNLSLAVDLFSMFLASLDAERESLVQYWESESLDELLESVHRLHGTSRYCGVPALRNALERFESLLKANHTSEFPKALKQVMNNISDLQHWIEANDWQTQLQQVHFDNTANA